MFLSIKKMGLLLGVFGVTLSSYAQAVEITYEQISQSGSHYEYSYTVNNTSSFDVEEFSIYFEVGSYENLQVVSLPTDWDPLVVQPVFLFDGYIDWLALGDVITSGDVLAGFNLSFDWIGSGSSPSAKQFFEVYNPSSFAVLADGETAKISADVPSPATWILMLTGLVVSRSLRRI